MSAVEVEVIHESDQVVAAEPKRIAAHARIEGVVTGTLLGFKNGGSTPLVIYPNQPRSGALAARAILDLHAAHIGKAVVMQFEAGNPMQPIVIGLLREGEGWPLPEQPGRIEVDVDGERLTIGAKRQLVLRCGKASITLTNAGKVLIQGTYVSTRSSGVMRIKGGSVQLN